MLYQKIGSWRPYNDKIINITHNDITHISGFRFTLTKSGVDNITLMINCRKTTDYFIVSNIGNLYKFQDEYYGFFYLSFGRKFTNGSMWVIDGKDGLEQFFKVLKMG